MNNAIQQPLQNGKPSFTQSKSKVPHGGGCRRPPPKKVASFGIVRMLKMVGSQGGCGGGKVEGRIFLKVDYFEALIKELGMKVDQCQSLYMWGSPLDRTHPIYSTVV